MWGFSQGQAKGRGEGCLPPAESPEEPRGAVGRAPSQHLLQDDADAKRVPFEGALPGGPGPPQQLRSRPQQLCNHRAGHTAGRSSCPSWARASHLGCHCPVPTAPEEGAASVLPDSQVRVLRLPEKKPSAQGHTTDHARGVPRLTNRSFRTYWQPPAHPELTFWDWPGAGSPLSVQQRRITIVSDL